MLASEPAARRQKGPRPAPACKSDTGSPFPACRLLFLRSTLRPCRPFLLLGIISCIILYPVENCRVTYNELNSFWVGNSPQHGPGRIREHSVNNFFQPGDTPPDALTGEAVCGIIFSIQMQLSSAAKATAGEPIFGVYPFRMGNPPPNPSANLVDRGISIMCTELTGTSKKPSFRDLGESFAPSMRYENPAIHKVFRNFHNFIWAKTFCPNHQKRVFRGCLTT